MRAISKTLTGLAVAMTTFISMPAQAVTMNFNYQAAGDGSGKTSIYGANSANEARAGFFIETFDIPNAPTPKQLLLWEGIGDVDQVKIEPGYAQPNGLYAGGYGGFSSYAAGNFSVTAGGFGIRNGGVTGVAANPAGDKTFFAYAPYQGGPLPSSVSVDFTTEQAAGAGLNYLGIYYGSIDGYNQIDFYSGSKLLYTVLGQDIITQLGAPAGNWLSDKSNVYVNLFFNPDEAWTSFKITSTGVAVEIDNIVVGRVPEPASLALFGVALAGLGLSRRKKG